LQRSAGETEHPVKRGGTRHGGKNRVSFLSGRGEFSTQRGRVFRRLPKGEKRSLPGKKRKGKKKKHKIVSAGTIAGKVGRTRKAGPLKGKKKHSQWGGE